MTFSEPQDFLLESKALHSLVVQMDVEALARQTLFKQWSFKRIIRHLHIWNRAAHLAMTDSMAFGAFADEMKSSIAKRGMVSAEKTALAGLSGPALVTEWIHFAEELAVVTAQREPNDRVDWVGPSMSVRSSITARLMETWAHGQAIYDELGLTRQNGDAIRGIVVLGYNTYGWSFTVRGETPPGPRPFLKLTAPTGAVWTFGDERRDECIEGLAEEFCQVITQVRNIADTNLVVTGTNAMRWMSIAQCFAGPPESPPSPGSRRRRERKELQ